MPSLDSPNDVADAARSVPESSRSSMPSCSTSVNATRSVNSLSSSPARTALATLPTPDWIGSSPGGILPGADLVA